MGIHVMKDEKKKQMVKAAIVVGGLLILWWLLNRLGGNNNKTVIAPGDASTLNSFQAPYFSTNPGIPDNWSLNTGGNPFNSTNNINVNTGFINGLSNLYMPMFGLVGMTAVSG